MQKSYARNNHANLSKYDIANDVEKIKAALASTAVGLKGKAEHVITQSLDNLQEHSAELQEKFEEFTAEKPYKAMGVAVCVGLVIGYFLGRR